MVEYSKAFWERFKELQDSERIASQIEKGEVKICLNKLSFGMLKYPLILYRHGSSEDCRQGMRWT